MSNSSVQPVNHKSVYREFLSVAAAVGMSVAIRALDASAEDDLDAVIRSFERARAVESEFGTSAPTIAMKYLLAGARHGRDNYGSLTDG